MPDIHQAIRKDHANHRRLLDQIADTQGAALEDEAGIQAALRRRGS